MATNDWSKDGQKEEKERKRDRESDQWTDCLFRLQQGAKTRRGWCIDRREKAATGWSKEELLSRIDERASHSRLAFFMLSSPECLLTSVSNKKLQSTRGLFNERNEGRKLQHKSQIVVSRVRLLTSFSSPFLSLPFPSFPSPRDRKREEVPRRMNRAAQGGTGPLVSQRIFTHSESRQSRETLRIH